jgi:hypothetical protein
MIRALLNRWKEGKAVRSIESAVSGQGRPGEALAAARDLAKVGTKRCVHALCLTLTHGPEELRMHVVAALAAVHKRHNDEQALKALNEAILSDHQADKVREAAIDALAEVVHQRHVGSFVELIKSTRTPLHVRTAAVRGLARVGYPELVERLVENCFFTHEQDPHGAIRRWAVQELRALNDPEKLTKLHEIAHGRRRLRYYSFSPERGDPATVVHLMAEADPDHATRFLGRMMDHSTQVISSAAAKAIAEVRRKRAAAGADAGTPVPRATRPTTTPPPRSPSRPPAPPPEA